MVELLAPFKVIMDWFMYHEFTIAGYSFSFGGVLVWTLLAGMVVWAIKKLLIE